MTFSYYLMKSWPSVILIPMFYFSFMHNSPNSSRGIYITFTIIVLSCALYPVALYSLKGITGRIENNTFWRNFYSVFTAGSTSTLMLIALSIPVAIFYFLRKLFARKVK